MPVANLNAILNFPSSNSSNGRSRVNSILVMRPRLCSALPFAAIWPAAPGTTGCDGPTGGLGLFPAAAEERTARNRQVLQPTSVRRRCDQLVPQAWEERSRLAGLLQTTAY